MKFLRSTTISACGQSEQGSLTAAYEYSSDQIFKQYFQNSTLSELQNFAKRMAPITFDKYLEAVIKSTPDEILVIDGMQLTGIKQRISSFHSNVSQLNGRYKNLGTYFQARGIQPAMISVAELRRYVKYVDQYSKGSGIFANGGIVKESSAQKTFSNLPSKGSKQTKGDANGINSLELAELASDQSKACDTLTDVEEVAGKITYFSGPAGLVQGLFDAHKMINSPEAEERVNNCEVNGQSCNTTGLLLAGNPQGVLARATNSAVTGAGVVGLMAGVIKDTACTKAPTNVPQMAGGSDPCENEAYYTQNYKACGGG